MTEQTEWRAEPDKRGGYYEGKWYVHIRPGVFLDNLDKPTAHRIAAVNELESALRNFMAGVSTGAVRVDSDEDERLADAWRKIHAALAKAKGET